MKTFTTRRKLIVAGFVGASIVAVLGVRALSAPKTPELKYRTATVDTGTIVQAVTATGTINPVALINVGSQVSGTVAAIEADFNDRVKKGQVLLRLDPTIFDAQIAQSRANLSAAEAQQHLAEANYERNKRLVEQHFVSRMALDQSLREVEVAAANVRLAQAQLARGQADLNNSVIRSPINGVVVKRSIDLGQTVAASFTTPTLYQIAQDLTKMQINTNVSEADIGALKDGQQAHFIVDAYPDREFEGRMRQFRLAPNVVQNVVTYDVVLDVDNRDLLLKPGMTAQVRLIAGSRHNVMRIPTAALRFRLSPEEEEKQEQQQALRDKKGVAATARPVRVAEHDDDELRMRGRDETSRVYKIQRLNARNLPEPVDVTIGLSNFRFTEVVQGALKIGDKVILRALTGGAGANAQ